jgi:hypothetical protein
MYMYLCIHTNTHARAHTHTRSQFKQCGGAGICPHQRRRSTCKECGGASIYPTHTHTHNILSRATSLIRLNKDDERNWKMSESVFSV